MGIAGRKRYGPRWPRTLPCRLKGVSIAAHPQTPGHGVTIPAHNPAAAAPDRTKDNGWLTNLSVRTKMLLAFGLLLLLVVLNTVVFFVTQAREHDSHEWTIHTHEVIVELDNMLVQALNQQTGLRGYRLSQQQRFLEPTRTGQVAFREHLAKARFLTRDNQAQRTRLEQAEAIIESWHREVVQPLIALPFGPESVAEQVRLIDIGKATFDQLRTLLDEMRDAEEIQLAQRTEQLELTMRAAKLEFIGLLLIGIVLVGLSLWLVQQQIATPLSRLTGLMARLSDGDHAIEVPSVERRDEIGALARALAVFKQMVIDIEQRSWVKTRAGEITRQLATATDRSGFADTLTAALAPLLKAGVSAFYASDAGGERLVLAGGYGHVPSAKGQQSYAIGEGLTGQCAAERKPILIESVPANYVRVQSATGAATPNTLLLLPVQTHERLLGVIEFGSFGRFDARQQALLDELLPVAALSLDNLQRALETKQLLEESQTLSEELQASEEEMRVQQEELRTANESLQGKSQQLQQQSSKLMASEEELKVQSEELQISNEELRQKGSILIEQKKALEALQQETQEKADELARASQYKSEFLANMSHELRTPLNSLLILSRGLADNDGGRLDADEVESATVIHESGSNLLRLINDILDLSKVESGKMELALDELSLAAFAGALNRNFRHVAKERGLDFDVQLAPELPRHIHTDAGKLEQVVNNLLSNAFKFTHAGSVKVLIARPAGVATGQISIQVRDTGVGIPKDKFEKVFQAFEQVDGSTSRHFGGTGLGLSIARGMAQLLGGSIALESTPGEGSCFTLLIGEQHGSALPAPVAATVPALPAASVATPIRIPAAIELPDDRDRLQPGDTVMLIIEDDPAFARILIDLVRRKGYLALFAGDGESGLKLASTFKPSGILLDVMLPGMDGWSVIERLKGDRQTRHIPVHFVSATDEHARGLDLGAVGFLTKPVTRDALTLAFDRLLHFAAGSMRRVLVVDDDANSRLAVKKLIAAENAEVSEAASGMEALAQLQAQRFDCVVLDLGMPDINGFEFLERAASLPSVPPVVVYSGRELSAEENLKLRQYTDSIVIKGARSPERLLDEVSLFLHSMRDTPAAPVREVDRTLSGRTVLVVDDDMRNIFALSKTLRAKGLKVVMAQDGFKALKQLEDNPDIELVLMDIMMPGMDGYQTMAEIRKQPALAALPIIALTAKAMRGDREKCLEAGANDYLSKPIELDKLFSLMRVWLSAS